VSVYTPVSEGELAGWLRNYSVGTLTACEPVEAGIENTNYFVTTTQGRYVLTLFERLPADELPFYIHLMAHLARHGIPCPAPIASLKEPGVAHCGELGALLARMHLAGRSYSAYLENPRGPRWWRFAAREVRPYLDGTKLELLEKELAYQSAQRFPDLPRGPVHADLFRDNTLWQDGRISGVVDFYFAGVDCFLYDIAVCVNDWCLEDFRGGCALDGERMHALLSAYHGIRALNALEREAWPAMLRAAALRFWLSRLYDFHLPRPGMLVHAHDPEHFRRILESRISAPARWTL
jgi:homoserine kinase type II